jgi:sulfatase modifying factor 1
MDSTRILVGVSKDARGEMPIRGGRFTMGSDDHYPEERPARQTHVAPFLLDATPVTNAAFSKFVAATGFVTFAERSPDPANYPGLLPEMTRAGSIVFQTPRQKFGPVGPESWWKFVRGANWMRPYGPNGPKASDDHPVVHVVWEDAAAFAQWAGKRLPTEVEMEFAARGGLESAEYAWGDELLPNDAARANIWLTGFPHSHPRRRRPPYTTSVTAFPANPYGLFDMIGNVWAWTSTYADGSADGPGCCIDGNVTSSSVYKVLKGGSHLCAPDYCQRYRPAARWFQPTDTSTSHVGFRCARSLDSLQ